MDKNIEVSTAELETVTGGAGYVANVWHALRQVPGQVAGPIAGMDQRTTAFIKNEPAFHQFPFNVHIPGFGSFGRFPIIGPAIYTAGAVTKNADWVARGNAITNGTLQAP